jgi:GNAT superfamily N-acetyltransferase
MEIQWINPRADGPFSVWFGILSQSELLRDPDRIGVWRPEELRARVLGEDAWFFHELALGLKGGIPVASMLLRLPRAPAGHLAELELHVEPARRRQGNGTAMLCAAEKTAQLRGAAGVVGQVQESVADLGAGDGRAFALAQGYGLRREGMRVDLPLPIDPNLAANLEEARWERAGCYHFETWRGPLSEARAAQIAGLFESMQRHSGGIDQTVDSGHLDLQWVRSHERTIERMGRDVFTAVAVETLSDELVGYSQITVSPAFPQTAYQWDTFVSEPHRGRGLGGLVKLSNVKNLQAHSSRTSLVRTYNWIDGGPMWTINKRLGSRANGAALRWEKRFDTSRAGGGNRAKSNVDPEFVRRPQEAARDGPQGTGFLCQKPVDAGVFLGDRLPHEDGEAVGGGGGG